jgi:starch synthase
MGAAGRQRAEREFSWPEAARQTVEIYHSVLAEKVFSR